MRIGGLYFNSFLDYSDFQNWRVSHGLYSISNHVFRDNRDELIEQFYASWKNWT